MQYITGFQFVVASLHIMYLPIISSLLNPGFIIGTNFMAEDNILIDSKHFNICKYNKQ